LKAFKADGKHSQGRRANQHRDPDSFSSPFSRFFEQTGERQIKYEPSEQSESSLNEIIKQFRLTGEAKEPVMIFHPQEMIF
jgi:hypothetical protein